ncbi:MAG: beta-lactamase family protein, partial [Chloroflexi bacterium]|nr:beta-lactamase family protein [Chloroflexota bacterium]
PDPTHQQLQTLLDRMVTEQGHPGMVLWVDAPDLHFAGASGYADPENGISMEPEDAFRIASVTKLFTATVILQLMEEHRLELDNTLDRWGINLPGAPDITIHQLLNHTSGVTSYTDTRILAALEFSDVYREWQPEEILALIADEPAQFAPGQFWQYSNTNYIILGMIIETATGMSLANNYRERIIDPLELTSTYLSEMEPPTAELVRGKSFFFDADRYHASMVWAAGGLVSSAPDLITFARALFSGDLFRESDTLEQMLTFESTPQEPQFDGYGLGVEMANTPLGRYWGHDGGIAGFAANLMYFEKHDMVIVALTNMDMTFGIDKPTLFDILATRR